MTDVYGYVKNGAEATLAANDDGAGWPNFLMELPYLPAGTYYVQVRYWSGGGTGPYNLATQCTPIARNLLSVTPTTGGTVTSSPAGISCGSQCTAAYPATQTVTLTAIPTSGSVFTGWSGSCGGTSPTCSLPMSAGRSVTALFVPASDDHGDTCETATPFPLNSYLAGHLERAGDHDWFRVSLPRAGSLYAVTGGTTDTWGDLYDGANTWLTSDDDSGPDYNFLIARSLAAGTHCIRVRHWSTGGTGSYWLQVNLY